MFNSKNVTTFESTEELYQRWIGLDERTGNIDNTVTSLVEVSNRGYNKARDIFVAYGTQSYS